MSDVLIIVTDVRLCYIHSSYPKSTSVQLKKQLIYIYDKQMGGYVTYIVRKVK